MIRVQMATVKEQKMKSIEFTKAFNLLLIGVFTVGLSNIPVRNHTCTMPGSCYEDCCMAEHETATFARGNMTVSAVCCSDYLLLQSNESEFIFEPVFEKGEVKAGATDRSLVDWSPQFCCDLWNIALGTASSSPPSFQDIPILCSSLLV